MIAATLFSGIGAPEQAMPEWDWRYCAEVEPFARAVLKARHPETKNLGDVNGEDIAARALDLGRANVIIFGTPCQSFSVAGRRLGMDDPRGNMALVALGVLARTKPAWFVFENVTGLLSVDEGRGFGVLLRAMDELGYSCCWSVLDSQWFGVAQRRERLFLVGHLGTEWRRPAAVLFESESVRGHSPPRRQTGERITGTVESRADAGGAGWGTDFLAGGGLATVDEITGAVSSKWHKRTGGPAGDECYNLIADPITANEGRTYSHEGRNNFRLRNVVGGCPHWPGCGCGTQSGPHSCEYEPVAFAENSRAEVRLEDGDGSTAASLKARGGKPGQGYPAVALASSVRRLTPRECERLMGFPDDYTLVRYHGKTATDGPRYRVLGNSMVVPVMQWILKRIEAVDKLA